LFIDWLFFSRMPSLLRYNRFSNVVTRNDRSSDSSVRVLSVAGANVDITLVDTGCGRSLPVITAFSPDGQMIRDLLPLNYVDPARGSSNTQNYLSTSSDNNRYSTLLRVNDSLVLNVQIIRVGDKQELQMIIDTEVMDPDLFIRSRLPVTWSIGNSVPVDESMLAALNRIPMTQKNGRPGVQDGVCTICYDYLPVESTQLLEMCCGHLFHEPCLRRWLKIQNSCPVCRSTIPAPQTALSPHVNVNPQSPLSPQNRPRNAWRMLPSCLRCT